MDEPKTNEAIDFEAQFAAELKKPLTARAAPEPVNLPARQTDFGAQMTALQKEVQDLTKEAHSILEVNHSARNVSEVEFALIEARDKLSEAIAKAGEFWTTRNRMREQLLNRRAR